MKKSLLFPAFAALVLAGCSSTNARDFNPTNSQRSSALQNRCISEDLRPRLKDPQSLRVLDKDHHSVFNDPERKPGDYTDFIYITYTATNGFGGRVKNTRMCGFMGNDLASAMNWEGDKAAPIDRADFILYRGDLVQ